MSQSSLDVVIIKTTCIKLARLKPRITFTLTKSRRVWWVVVVARMGSKRYRRNGRKIWGKEPCLGDLGADGGDNVKVYPKGVERKVLIGFMWLKIWTSTTPFWNFGFHKMYEISWAIKQSLAPQDGFSSIYLVTYLVCIHRLRWKWCSWSHRYELETFLPFFLFFFVFVVVYPIWVYSFLFNDRILWLSIFIVCIDFISIAYCCSECWN